MKHVILSPHFDDAVYSCGGWIYALTTAGASVTVLTVMAGEPAFPVPDTPLVRDLHQRWAIGNSPVLVRRQEDQQAVGLLGASVQFGTTPDCVYRVAGGVALYPDEASLWGAIHPDDPARDLPIILDLDAHYYAPLGVGNHVDHRLVRDWALAHIPPDRLTLYTDYPYLRDVQRVNEALAQLSVVCHEQWQRLTADQLDTKIRAMRAYVSQVSTFWADEAVMADEVRRLFVDDQGYFAERFWRLNPAV